MDFKAHQVFAVGRAVAFTGARVRSERVDKAFIVACQCFQVAQTAFEAGNHARIQGFVFDKSARRIDADNTERVVRFVFGNQQFAVWKLLYGGRLVHTVEHINAQSAQLCRIIGRLSQKGRQGLHADKRGQRSQKPPAEYGIRQVDVFELFVRQQTQPVKVITHLLIDLFAVAHNLLHHFPILLFLHLHTVFVN